MSRVIDWSGGRSAAAAIIGSAANDVRTAAVPSLILLLFWILQNVENHAGITAALVLFLGLLWLVQVAFCVAIMPVIRFAGGAETTMTAVSVAIRMFVAVFLAAFWAVRVVERL